MLVSLKKRPDLAVPGMKIKVEMPTSYIGPKSDKPTVMCNGYITEVVRDYYSKEIRHILFNIKPSKAKQIPAVENMMSLSSQLDDIFVDVAKCFEIIEYPFETVETKIDTNISETRYDKTLITKFVKNK